jgi:hypothetical protein
MYEINMSPETEVEDFDHHKENVVWYGNIFEVWVYFLDLVTYSRCILHV